MSSAVFTTGNQAYQVAKIVYAGPVGEIPAERRRNGSTHSFKVITPTGATFCYYKDVDAARKARGALTGMLETLKPNGYTRGNEYLDPTRVVSFSNVMQFKKPIEECTHGCVVSVETADERNREVWMRFKSEDHARKSRKALWAILHAVNGLQKAKDNADEGEPVTAVASDACPF